jgi:hypothetical protein
VRKGVGEGGLVIGRVCKYMRVNHLKFAPPSTLTQRRRKAAWFPLHPLPVGRASPPPHPPGGCASPRPQSRPSLLSLKPQYSALGALRLPQPPKAEKGLTPSRAQGALTDRGRLPPDPWRA